MPELKETETDTETQSDFDMDAATAEISSDLFGQGKEEDKPEGEKSTEGEEDKSSDGPEAVEAAETPPQTDEEKAEAEAAAKELETSAEVQETGAPKTWTKEALAEWATISPRAQQEILKREEDFLKGITQYKTAADIGMAYDRVVEPYKPILAAENVDPVQMFQSFAANHYLLTKGTPEQKIELAASMLTGYNIPLAQLLEYIADGGGGSAPVDPEVAALKKEVADLRQFNTKRQTEETAVIEQRISDEITVFASDPAHPYFNEVADDISKLFGSGMAKTLAEAYEKAVYANPTTRQKEIDRLTAERTSTVKTEEQKRKDKVAKSTADKVEITPKSRDGTVSVGSMDDTLKETLAAIEARG